MNKKLIFLVINFLYMVTATAQPLLIPYPRSIEMREGYFALTAKTGIINLSDKNNARLLKHYIEEDININLHEQRGDNNIFLITNRKLKESLGAEGYRMNISADSIVIEGAENARRFLRNPNVTAASGTKQTGHTLHGNIRQTRIRMERLYARRSTPFQRESRRKATSGRDGLFENE